MNAGCLLQLHENLKGLTLGNAARHLEERLRQAEERGASYEEFLLELTELELQIRSENREKRRLKEALQVEPGKKFFHILRPLQIREQQ